MATVQAQQFDLFGQADVAQAMPVGQDVLPRLALEMIEVMGRQATAQLVAAAGGTTIMVPGWPLKRASSRFERLAQVVGQPAAVAFAERWGNKAIAVPKCEMALRRDRNRRILAALDSGKSHADVARDEGLHERHVKRISKRLW